MIMIFFCWITLIMVGTCIIYKLGNIEHETKQIKRILEEQIKKEVEKVGK